MADNSYEQLIDDYENGFLVEPGESLTNYIKRMGGVNYPTKKADGGSIGIEVLFQPKREEYQTGGRTIDSRATTQDYTNALKNVSAGTTYQQQADAKKYARNEAANELTAARRGGDVALDNFLNSAGPGASMYRSIFADSRPGRNRQGAFTSTYDMKKDQLLDLLMNRKLQPTSYAQPAFDPFKKQMDELDAIKAENRRLVNEYTKNNPSTINPDPSLLGNPGIAQLNTAGSTSSPPTPAYMDQTLLSQLTKLTPKQATLFDPFDQLSDLDQYNLSQAYPELQSQLRDSSYVSPYGLQGDQELFSRRYGLKKGGRVGLFMGGDPLTGQALSIYDSMKAYNFSDQEIANALSARGLSELGSTPASETPVTNTATNIINQGGDGGNNSNTLQSFRQDPSVMPAFEALQRNQQLTSMGINDPFANEASLSGAYYGDMPEDTSNQVGVYQPSMMENIKNKIGGTKIGSMFTGVADKLTNNKFVNALGTAASFAKSPLIGGAKMLASGLSGLTNRLPTSSRAINENIAANLGIGVDDIGRIQGDYTTPGGVMSGYNLNQMDANSFDKRTDNITQTLLSDKYGFTVKEIEEVIDGTYTGKKGYNKTMGKQTNLVRDLRNIGIAKGIILNSKELGLKELERIEKQKADAAAAASYANERQVLDDYFGGSGAKGPTGNRFDGADNIEDYSKDPTSYSGSSKDGGVMGYGGKSGTPRYAQFKDGGLATMFVRRR